MAQVTVWRNLEGSGFFLFLGPAAMLPEIDREEASIPYDSKRRGQYLINVESCW